MGWGYEMRAYPSDDLNIGRSRAVTRRYGIYDCQDVLLHHPHIVRVVLALGHVAEVLNEVHDVCPVVHRVLEKH